MSLLKEFQLSFESNTTFENDEGEEGVVTVASATEIQEIHDGQAATRDTLGTSESLSSDQVSKVNNLLTSLDDSLDVVKEASPALITPMVDTLNDQVNDAAQYLGVTPPPLLTLDKNTNTLDQVSLESVSTWISKAWSAFKTTLDQLSLRLKTTLTRFKITTTSLQTRIGRVSQALTRRTELSNKPLSLNPNYLSNLVLGKEIAKDPIAEMRKISEVILKLSGPSRQLVSDVRERLIPVLEGKKSGEGLDKELAKLKSSLDLTKIIGELAKSKQEYIGNHTFTGDLSRDIISNGRFTSMKATGITTAVLNQEIPNLDKDVVQTWLSALKKEIANQMTVIDGVLESIHSDTYALSSTHIDSSSIFDDEATAEINSLNGIYIADLFELSDSLGEMFYYYFNVADSILVYIEESVLNS